MTKPRIFSQEASKGTKRRRSAQLAGVRELVSGSQEAATVQLREEIGREKLLQDSQFHAEITTADALAMKANYSLPWNKLRLVRRYIVYTRRCTIPNWHAYAHIHVPVHTLAGLRHEGLLYPVKRS